MCRLLLMTIALLLILFGISGFWMMPKLLQRKIEQRMELKIGTQNYERFTRVPIPLTVKFHLFNITNKEQVLSGLERPKFEEVGPFMYKQWRRRDIVDFEDNNRRIRYKEYKTFYPMFSTDNNNSSSHNNSTSDQYLNPKNFKITMINVPLLSLLTKFSQLESGSLKRSLIAKVASRLIHDKKDKILITKQANEILFDGYKVDFMESARDLISGILNFNFDSPLPGNKFGFFYGKNGTWTKENGELTIFTGRNNSMDDFFQIDNWNDQRELNVWRKDTIAGNRCNQIKGTDGSQFHPGVTRDQQLSLFTPLVCRSLYIKYKEDTSAYDIPLLRFGTPPELFAAPRKRPENACFCTIPQQSYTNNGHTTPDPSNQKPSDGKSGISDSRCYIDGLMDLSLCQKGAPIAASAPHFYNADPMLAMAANMNPRREIHETFIDVEPMTGSVFRAASRAQLNAFVEKSALEVIDSSIVGNMTPMVAPLLWLEEAGGIDLRSSNEFKDKLLNLVLKAKRTFLYTIIAGIVLATLVCIEYWYRTCYKIESKRATTNKRNSYRVNARRVANDNKSRSKVQKIKRNRQMHENMLLSTGAQKSNLAAKLATEEEDFDQDELMVGQGTGSGSKLRPTIMVSGLLGAAHGKAGKGRKSSATNQQAKDVHELDEDELSKKMLVGNEWGASGSSGGESSNDRLSRNAFQAAAENQASSNLSNSGADYSEDDEIRQAPLDSPDGSVDLMQASTSNNSGTQ